MMMIQVYRIILNLDQRLDQRVYNEPITKEVAAVWIDETKEEIPLTRTYMA